MLACDRKDSELWTELVTQDWAASKQHLDSGHLLSVEQARVQTETEALEKEASKQVCWEINELGNCFHPRYHFKHECSGCKWRAHPSKACSRSGEHRSGGVWTQEWRLVGNKQWEGRALLQVHLVILQVGRVSIPVGLEQLLGLSRCCPSEAETTYLALDCFWGGGRY